MNWESFLHGNEWYWRLLRTVVQAVLGVLVAEIDAIVGTFTLDPTLKPMIVGIVMTILSPLMAKLGVQVYEKNCAKAAALASGEVDTDQRG